MSGPGVITVIGSGGITGSGGTTSTSLYFNVTLDCLQKNAIGELIFKPLTTENSFPIQLVSGELPVNFSP